LAAKTPLETDAEAEGAWGLRVEEEEAARCKGATSDLVVRCLEVDEEEGLSVEVEVKVLERGGGRGRRRFVLPLPVTMCRRSMSLKLVVCLLAA